MITLVIMSRLFYKICMNECCGRRTEDRMDVVEFFNCNGMMGGACDPDEALARSIRNAFEEKRLHLNPELNLSLLATECGTNRTYLSEYLNRRLKMSFNDFVNDYRIVNESIPLINKLPHMSFAYIAEKSGFGSVATFRRAFIRKIGMTPSEYKDMVRKKMMSGDRTV